MPPISLRMLPHTRATLMAYSRRITPQREFAKPLTVLLRLSISPILTSPPMMLVGGLGVALVVDVVDEVPVDEETVVVPNDKEEDVGKEVDDSVLLVVDEALLLADVLEPLEVDVMLVDDDSDDDESVLLAVDDEILLNDELESLDVGITLLDDSDPVLLVEVVGMLLDELNEVLVNETLELLSEADDVLLLELSEEVLLLMELEVSDELEEELLERLSEEVVEDIELVGVALDEELGELSVLLVIGFSSEVVEELLDAVDEVPEVVGSSIVDELPELEDAVVDAVETDVEELKELKVVGVLDELLDSVGEDEELPVLDDDVVGLEEKLSVLADDVAELEEGPLVLVDDNVLEITLLVTLLDNEEDVSVLDEIGELAEDEGVNTGHDVPVVEILVMVVVAVLVTVCDI
ncbi:unnamed protein product [Alternaria alternata]